MRIAALGDVDPAAFVARTRFLSAPSPDTPSPGADAQSGVHLPQLTHQDHRRHGLKSLHRHERFHGGRRRHFSSNSPIPASHRSIRSGGCPIPWRYSSRITFIAGCGNTSSRRYASCAALHALPLIMIPIDAGVRVLKLMTRPAPTHPLHLSAPGMILHRFGRLPGNVNGPVSSPARNSRASLAGVALSVSTRSPERVRRHRRRHHHAHVIFHCARARDPEPARARS